MSLVCLESRMSLERVSGGRGAGRWQVSGCRAFASPAERELRGRAEECDCAALSSRAL